VREVITPAHDFVKLLKIFVLLTETLQTGAVLTLMAVVLDANLNQTALKDRFQG
jgi:hypothetical protein